MMSEINLKGNDNKTGTTDTEILKAIAGKLFVYEEIRMKFFLSLLFLMWVVVSITSFQLCNIEPEP